jgi:hypothetical protein
VRKEAEDDNFYAGNEGTHDLVSADQVSTFGHPELLFQELIIFDSSFMVLLQGSFF